MSAESKLALAKRLAAEPNGFSNGEFAKAAGISSNAAGAYLTAWVKAGHISRGAAEGHHGRFFDTSERAEQFKRSRERACGQGAAAQVDRVQLARRAVGHIKKGLIGSAALAKLCDASAAAVDAALDPLVVPGRLMRVSVLRGGAPEFDYRLSAAWTPKESDFAVCAIAGAAPTPTISPVAAPSPKALNAPASARPQISQAERVQASRNGATSRAAARAHEQALAAAASLGWAPAAGEERREPGAQDGSAPSAVAPASCEARGDGDAASPERTSESAQPAPAQPPQAVSIAQPAGAPAQASQPQEIAATSVIRVDDLVCAMNSRGELALDLDERHQVVFPPAQAMYLKRFLVNTSVIEALDAKGLV